MYGNEEAVGQAISNAVTASEVARKDLHVTTKVWHDHLAPDALVRSFETSLEKLKVDYVDLYMVHWPARDMNLPEIFETLARLQAQGRTRAVGVCNFHLAAAKNGHRRHRRPHRLQSDRIPRAA